MKSSPLTSQSGLATFTIKTNGTAINPILQVYSLTIYKEITKDDFAEITLLAGNSADGFSEISDSDAFSPGSHIEINLGYNNKNEKVFTGSVIKQIVNANAAAGSFFKIICSMETNSAKEIDIISPPSLQVEYGVDINEIELALNKKYESSVLTKYSGYIVFQGTTLAKENSLLSLKGFGKRFTGDVFISGVEHKISDGNWLTKVKIGVNPELYGELKFRH